MAYAFISEQNKLASPNLNYVWDPNTMAWVKMEQPILEAGSVTVSGTIAVSNFPAQQHVILDSGTLTSITNPVATLSGLSVGAYDYISLSYTGSNLTTVVFKSGGAGGTTVATLTLGYSGSTLTSVTKS